MKFARILAFPVLAWFFFFVLAPLFLIVAVSFAQRGTYGGIDWTFTLANYAKLRSPALGRIVFESLWLATVTAVCCVTLGTLAAWAMATAPAKRRDAWLIAIALPFLTNGLIRVLGLRTLVGAGGPLQWLLTATGVPFDPFAMTANSTLVFYGMVSTYLPFAVLPLYGAFEKFDFTLVEAAQDLGAGPWTTFRRVIVPRLKPAIAGAFLLVFIPCLGEYVIPDLLGGAKTMLLGNLITEQFLKARDWPLGSAVGLALIFSLLAAWLAVRKWRPA